MCSWVDLHRRPFVFIYPQKGVKKGKNGANLSVKRARPDLHRKGRMKNFEKTAKSVSPGLTSIGDPLFAFTLKRGQRRVKWVQACQ